MRSSIGSRSCSLNWIGKGQNIMYTIAVPFLYEDAECPKNARTIGFNVFKSSNILIRIDKSSSIGTRFVNIYSSVSSKRKQREACRQAHIQMNGAKFSKWLFKTYAAAHCSKADMNKLFGKIDDILVKISDGTYAE